MRHDVLPTFRFDPAPREASCERCAAGSDGDLRFVILRGRTRYVGRTLCDTCSEEALEMLIESPFVQKAPAAAAS